MAVVTDFTFSFGGTDYSDQVISLELNSGVEEVDATVMGDLVRTSDGALEFWSLTVETTASEASGGVLADLFSQQGDVGAIAVKESSAATSATNPEYAGSARLISIDGLLAGTVGDRKTATLNFAADGQLSRGTT